MASCPHTRTTSDDEQVIKLHWFFQSGELDEDTLMTTMTAEVVARMGQKELLSYSGDTFDHVDAVHHLISVVSFEPHTLSLSTIDEETRYTRTNFTVVLGLNTKQYSLLEVSAEDGHQCGCQGLPRVRVASNQSAA